MPKLRETSSLNSSCPCCGNPGSSLWMVVPDRFWGKHDSYDLLHCAACSHTWLANPPSPEELVHYYNPEYHKAVGSTGEISAARWAKQLAALQRYKSGGSILDIGCSSGGFLSYLKDGPWRLHGIEAEPSTAQRARAITGGEIFAGDVLQATFPAESFDVITCSDVLEHLYEPRHVFLKIYQWLKPGGIFYAFVPNILSWEARVFRTHWYGLDLPRHLHHYSVGSLRALGRFASLPVLRMLTPPGCYLEQSASILVNDLISRSGLKRPAIDLSGEIGLIGKVIRKLVRLSAEAAYSNVASVCGAAASVQAIFQKASMESEAGHAGSGRSGAFGNDRPEQEPIAAQTQSDRPEESCEEIGAFVSRAAARIESTASEDQEPLHSVAGMAFAGSSKVDRSNELAEGPNGI